MSPQNFPRYRDIISSGEVVYRVQQDDEDVVVWQERIHQQLRSSPEDAEEILSYLLDCAPKVRQHLQKWLTEEIPGSVVGQLAQHASPSIISEIGHIASDKHTASQGSFKITSWKQQAHQITSLNKEAQDELLDNCFQSIKKHLQQTALPSSPSNKKHPSEYKAALQALQICDRQGVSLSPQQQNFLWAQVIQDGKLPAQFIEGDDLDGHYPSALRQYQALWTDLLSGLQNISGKKIVEIYNQITNAQSQATFLRERFWKKEFLLYFIETVDLSTSQLRALAARLQEQELMTYPPVQDFFYNHAHAHQDVDLYIFLVQEAASQKRRQKWFAELAAIDPKQAEKTYHQLKESGRSSIDADTLLSLLSKGKKATRKDVIRRLGRQ